MLKARMGKPKKKRGGGKTTIVLVAVFLLGVCLLLYPTIADYVNQKHQSDVVAGYESTVSALDEKDYDELYAAAEAYNEALAALQDPYYEYDEAGDYDSLLDVSGTGVMGYITIDRINVELPIYHGTSEGVLNVAVGHLEGSSLPVGGKGTHCTLSAHRGLPSAKLFTDLDEMREGDTFTIKVLDRTLTYQVDQIRIVLPEEISELAIDPNEDYCTLVTCTPYGLNTHRLLVRGTRIANAEEALYAQPDAYVIDSLLAAPVVAVPILLALFIYLMVRYRKKPRHGDSPARIIREGSRRAPLISCDYKVCLFPIGIGFPKPARDVLL